MSKAQMDRLMKAAAEDQGLINTCDNNKPTEAPPLEEVDMEEHRA